MRLGVYEVTAPLGAGGMGEVYRATDSKLKREVALKVLPADVASSSARLARFQREAELLASLNHPNIAHVYGLEESGGVTALIMELVEGQDLSRRIACGAIPIDEALLIAKQIATALEAAHEQGIVHRDLKPANIKVRPDGTVKVLDFGLAKSLSPSGTEMMLTVTGISSPGAIIGTPAYMSPEQARGETTGRETDIWAFGAVLYELLTGASPFARPTSTETLAQVLTAPLNESPLPAAAPASVRRLVRRCLERDPKRRWRHMGDARIEIEEALAASTEPAAGAAAIRATPVPRRTVLRYGAAAVALLASGLGGGVWLDRRLRSAPIPSFRRLTFRRGLIRSARFAPDGETILYGALWDGDRCRVHTVRVDGPESRPLDLPDANVLAISRSGEAAVALGAHHIGDGAVTYGTLARVPIAGGAPRPIVEDVKFADWSPDGTELAIVRRVDGRDQLEYPIGKVLVAPAAAQGSGLGFARIAPDGKRVAFVGYRRPSSLTGRVAIVDQSGTVTPLSTEYMNIHGLAWRGDEVLYTAADERPLFRALRAVIPGGASRTITRMPGNVTVWDALPDGRVVIAHTDDHAVMAARFRDDSERNLSWFDSSRLEDLSHDGKLLLFTENGQAGGPESAAYLRGTDGSPAVRLGAGRAVALSPDSRSAITLPAIFPSPYLELLPTGAGEPRRFAANGLAYFGARWLPDGKRFIVSAVESGRQPRLFLHDLGPGRPAAITPEGVGAWVISPDGSTVAARGPDPTIRLYNLHASAPRQVPGLTGAEVPVGWITDGLLVMRPGASPLGEIYRIDTRTGRQDVWKNILPRDPAGIMNLISFRVTPDGQSLAYTWHRALSSLYVADGLA